MNLYLLIAGGLALGTGVAHSWLGERLIFRALRGSGVLPERPAPPLRLGHLRIVWATWHLASVLGWGFAWLLWRMASMSPGAQMDALVTATVASFSAGSLLVLGATRGRHPGWISLGAVAALVGFGAP